MTTGLGRINHIVVLMLENRSFDQMLGLLYQEQGNVSPLGQPFEGLQGQETNPDQNGKPVQVFPIQANAQYSYFMPKADPGEGFLNTNAQLFGTTTPAPTAAPTNQGFVTNFDYTLSWEAKQQGRVLPGTQASDIMGVYPPEMLPVLSGLARGYAVCDHWYASIPTETMPNRAFALQATSQGHMDDHTRVYTAPSIFTLLTQKQQSWAVYGYDAPPLTRQSIADITHAPNTNFGEFKDFVAAIKSNKLASFVFLEPQWGAHGNSQHPNYDVALGEQFIRQVYYALYGSKLWPETLLIITYDEHGGCYDHVAPPTGAVPPDNTPGEFGFDFKRFGLRVPTVLVSPWIKAGTVYRVPGAQGNATPTPFDHTSTLATVEARFGLGALTARDAAASHVGGVLTLKTARTDDPLASVTPPKSTGAPLSAAPSHLEQVLAQSLANLPDVAPAGAMPHAEQTLAFNTGAEAVAYARKRAHDYYKKL